MPYLVVSYKESSHNYCRGCLMAFYPSDFVSKEFPYSYVPNLLHANAPGRYNGLWKEDLIEQFTPQDTQKQEGFVIRVAENFHFSQFRKCVAKWVRERHVTTTHHWRFQPVIRNQLRSQT